MKRAKFLFILLICSLVFSYGYAFAEGEEDIKKNQVGEVFELGEVVVTANSSVINLSTTVTEVSAEDITARGTQNVAEALEMIPGVNVKEIGKNAQIFIRGFSQEDVKVLIDGVPAYQTYDKVVDLSLIPVDSISKITVTKGASSVLYGANTFGGVINIVTKKGGKDAGGEVTASFGENSTQNYILNYGGSKNAFNYWLTFSHRTSDGFELSDDFVPTSWEDGGTRDLSDYEMNTFNAKVGFEPDEETKLYVSFDYHDNKKGVPTSDGTYWSFIKWDQWHLNLVGEQKITDTISTKARLFYVSHKDTLEDVAPVPDPGRWWEMSSYDDHSIGAEVQTSFNFGPMSYLTIGLNYLDDNHKQQDYFTDDMDAVDDEEVFAGYQPEEEFEAETYTIAAEDEIHLLDNDLSFVVGASYDYYNPKKGSEERGSTDSLNPQLGVVYNIADNASIHASAGKKIRFPRLKELYSVLAGGNDSLNPQETIAYEIGTDYLITPDIKTSVAFFYNDITDLIQRLGSGRNKYYTNIGKSTIQGLEFAVSYKALDNLSFGTSYTYLSAYDDTNDVRLLDRPRHKIAFDTRYWILSNLFTSLQASYTTGAVTENDDREIIGAPGYFLMNAKAELKIINQLQDKLIKDASIFLSANNIFDKNYYEGYDPQPGRSFLFGFNAKF